MKKLAVLLIALVVFSLSYFRGRATAQSVDRSCQSACVQECLATSTTPATASKCGKACVHTCRNDVTAPQDVFSGPVTATPVQCTTDTSLLLSCASQAGNAECSVTSGTVANQASCGGNVAIWVICPAGTPNGNPGQSTTTTVIGTATSDPNTCAFTMTTTNACAGQTGCYGLVAATPPPSAGLNPTPDPGWRTCTGGSCPSPSQ